MTLSKQNSIHEGFIKRCFELAKTALGETSPNPYVGSVIVKNGLVIGEGYHKKSGTNHAEINALENCKDSPRGATLYCNLEPCCHTNKKTPPCAQRLVEEGIAKVVISNLDPNPKVAGNGVQILKDAGIEVIVGILQEDGENLNEVFFTHITKKRPFIHLKWAQTLDGKIATNSFNSKWITSETARHNVHLERNLYDAIMVGAKTVNNDDPKLTIRLKGEKPIKRIIVSRSGNIQKSCKLLTDQFKDYTYLVTGKETSVKLDVKTIRCRETEDSLELNSLLEELYKAGIHSIYIEGGATLINSFIVAKLFDRLSVYIAPKIIGAGIQSVFSPTVDSIKDGIHFEHGKWITLGSDILFQNKRHLCLQD